MRRVVALASAALAACAVAVVLAAPASAHANAVSLSSVCLESGQRQITVTTVNDFGLQETVTFSGSLGGSTTIGPNGTDVRTFLVSGSTSSVTVNAHGEWTDHVVHNASASLALQGTCTEPTPPTTPTTPTTAPPAVEGTVVVRGQAAAAVAVQAQPALTG
jgi:hypothetical protein